MKINAPDFPFQWGRNKPTVDELEEEFDEEFDETETYRMS